MEFEKCADIDGFLKLGHICIFKNVSIIIINYISFYRVKQSTLYLYVTGSVGASNLPIMYSWFWLIIDG